MNAFKRKGLVFVVTLISCCLIFAPTIGVFNSSSEFDELVETKNEGVLMQSYTLPPPSTIDMPLEEAMWRRMSIREFTGEPVTDEELSTILWSACGYRNDGKRTIYNISGNYATEIYVLKEDAAYKYDALTHSLIQYKEGDYRNQVGWQYEAPIQLALAWNRTKGDEKSGCAQIGGMYQNIAFAANAIGLGAVVTAEVPTSPIDRRMGLPATEKGKIVMPLGHPEHFYDFEYKPQWISLLPKIEITNMSLTTALERRIVSMSFEGELTRQEMSQLVWSSYGYSNYLDKSEQEKNVIKRHRTLPSGHGYYPFDMYVVTETGIYRYFPNLLTQINWFFNNAPVDFFGIPIMTFLVKIANGDLRNEIAQSSHMSAASAPLIIISVLNIEHTRPEWSDDFSGEEIRWVWHFEAGSSAHNIMLEATALNLGVNVFSVTDDDAICRLLGLDENFDPIYIIPVGR